MPGPGEWRPFILGSWRQENQATFHNVVTSRAHNLTQMAKELWDIRGVNSLNQKLELNMSSCLLPRHLRQSVWHTVAGSHILWTFGQIVHSTVCEVLVQSCVLQLVHQECWVTVLKAKDKSKNMVFKGSCPFPDKRELDGGRRWQHCPLPCEAGIETAVDPWTKSTVVGVGQGSANPGSSLDRRQGPGCVTEGVNAVAWLVGVRVHGWGK